MLTKLTRKSFWVNLLAAVILAVIILVIFLFSLNYWTRHGQYLKVPDVKGKSMEQAVDLLEDLGFEVMIQDSVYSDTIAPLAVVKQFPDPESSVKVNRTVYLTVNRSAAPIIEMPNLVGMSFRNAELELRARGLKLGDTSYRPDIAKNAVLEQRADGQSIKPGENIRMGTEISLVLGAGVGSVDMPVPDLFGMTYQEARILLEGMGINQGVVIADPGVVDSSSAFVFRQSPNRFDATGKTNRIRPGQMMDIWIGTNKPIRQLDTSAGKQNDYQTPIGPVQ